MIPFFNTRPFRPCVGFALSQLRKLRWFGLGFNLLVYDVPRFAWWFRMSCDILYLNNNPTHRSGIGVASHGTTLVSRASLPIFRVRYALVCRQCPPYPPERTHVERALSRLFRFRHPRIRCFLISKEGSNMIRRFFIIIFLIGSDFSLPSDEENNQFTIRQIRSESVVMEEAVRDRLFFQFTKPRK